MHWSFFGCCLVSMDSQPGIAGYRVFWSAQHIWMIVLRTGLTHLSPFPLAWLSGLVHFNCSLPSRVWMEVHQLKELTVVSACLCAERWLSHCPCFCLVLLLATLSFRCRSRK